MALDKDALSTLMQSKGSSAVGITDAKKFKAFCDAMADAIITHLKTAVVAGSVTSGSGSGGTIQGTLT